MFDDPQIEELIRSEEERQATELCLIPSENHVSAGVMAALGSRLTDKYSEGYPGRRYYEGNGVVDGIESLAMARARELFGAEHANVQPLSGAPANLAVYAAFLEPGDTVMGLSLPDGGHLTHGWGVSVTGRWFRSVPYRVRRETGVPDLDEVRELALRERPKVIWCGGTAVPRTIDFAGFAEIAREAGAILAADIAHIAGLIAGAAHPTSIGHADVTTTTTHKTLRGPRGAMLLTSAEHANAIDRAVFPGLQGGPHDHTTAAIAVALREAAQPDFSDYAHQIVANAKALAEGLLARGFDLVTGGTDNHLLLVDLTARGVTGGNAAEGLARAGLICNRNAIPFDPRKPLDPSGIRLGTPALTTRGMREPEMAVIAGWIDDAIDALSRGDEDVIARLRGDVAELAAAHPLPTANPYQNQTGATR